MISIYTHTNNPFKKEFWKYVVKKVIRKYSGPDAVLDSLKRGLTAINIPYEVNPLKPKYDTIHVLSGVEILKEMIDLKKNGKIKKLVAGPTVVTTINDENRILTDSNIDILLTPSEWVTDFYVSLSPASKDKIHSWPAGVQIPNEVSTHTGDVIVFRKNIGEDIFIQATEALKRKKIKYTVLLYGTFSHAKYIGLVKKSPFMVYLQESESQGIALQEAWSYNVPTLVHKNTQWASGKYSWQNESIAAPYLKPEAGLFFTLNDFEDTISRFNQLDFNPRKYCEENLSDLKSAEKLIHILQHYEKTH